DGIERTFESYKARGAGGFDDGTISPTAAAASLPFAPDIVMPTLRHWMQDRPELMTKVGFVDSFNPTFDLGKRSGWVDQYSLGLDQGPIVLAVENYRNRNVWQRMKQDPYIVQGLKKA